MVYKEMPRNNTRPVIIIDASRDFRLALHRIIGSHFPGVTTLDAWSADSAIRAMEEHPPVMVIMDFHPDARTANLIATIKAKAPGTPLVVLTSNDAEEYREIAYAQGADHFLSKAEGSVEELLDLMQNTLH